MIAYWNYEPIYCDRFQELPIYFLRFFGSTDVDKVIESVRR